MPIYEYRCKECGHAFEKFYRISDSGEVNCPSCQSTKVDKLLSSPLFRMGKSSEPATESAAKDAEVKYFKDRKDYERAARVADKAGRSEWEIKDLYPRARKET